MPAIIYTLNDFTNKVVTIIIIIMITIMIMIMIIRQVPEGSFLQIMQEK